MKPFDCHTHIYDDAFSADFEQMISQAKKVLSGIIVVGEGPESNRKITKLVNDNPEFLFAGYGIHPEFAHEFTEKEIGEEIKWIKKQKPVCIGEVGLDMMWIKRVLPKQIGIKKADEAWPKQQKVFERFIELADELKIPLNIHSRWATKHVIETLEKLKPKKAILHAFSGSAAEARRAVALGYKISLGTSIMYAEQKQNLAKRLPLDTLLLETDSPVLAPVRGQRNEPANVALVVKEIARLKCVSEAEVIEATNKSVKEIFNII
ncbi:MAG: TatD family hydrolase [DPANN group archaeon]|nr:TatD family hydrolase [DPANN group archaeon]